MSYSSKEILSAYCTEKITEWFSDSINSPQSILDIGCNTGVMTQFLQRAFPLSTVTGIDNDALRIDEARANAPECIFKVADANNLPFEDDTFDIAIASLIVHHLPKAEHQSYMQEMKRVLKPGGSLIIIELNPFNLKVRKEFAQNHKDSSAQLLLPWHTYKICKGSSHRKLHFFCFPSCAHPKEGALSKIPFGQLYAVIAKK